MKKLLTIYTTVFIINVIFVVAVIKMVEAGTIESGNFRAFFTFAGIKQENPITEEISGEQTLGGEDPVTNTESNYSYFAQIDTGSNDLTGKVVPVMEDNYGVYSNVDYANLGVDSDMIYFNSFTELPLHPTDYYIGKFPNASAGANQLNNMPILRAGSRISVIDDGYINIKHAYGYIMPPAPHGVFGSGLCWATSTLGAMQDKANQDFRAKYGIDLFVFYGGDRAPHGGYYLTYTNGRRGYTVLQSGATGRAVQDYRFTVNPLIKNIPGMEDFKIKIFMLHTNKHPNGSHGESIAGFILSNKEF